MMEDTYHFSERDYRPLKKLLDTKCFGCSPTNHSGLKMMFMTGKDHVISRLMIPSHLCGWKNIVHGGILATVLDETMSWSTIHLLKRVVLTTSMTIDFIKPVFSDSQITSVGRIHERLSEREAVIEGAIYNSDGNICTKSKGIFRLFTVEAARKLNLMSRDILDDFDNFITTE